MTCVAPRAVLLLPGQRSATFRVSHDFSSIGVAQAVLKRQILPGAWHELANMPALSKSCEAAKVEIESTADFLPSCTWTETHLDGLCWWASPMRL